jgi:homoserine dehydrogenase
VADVDLERPRPVTVERELLTDDPEAVIRDPEIDVIVELIGGIEPARTLVESALNAGKHVVTANKAMLAQHGAELLALAQRKRVRLLFEAAVGGGVPVIRALTECLAANRITRIEGILNGTCNYILTQMATAGMSFEEALRDGQQRGYAEPDPTADIESVDAANKVAILAALAFDLDIRYGDVACEGISDLTQQDLKAAEADGYAVKQLAVAEMDDDGAVAVGVCPVLLWKDHPLASVGDVLNGILLEGRPVGAVLLVGPGAGPQPTASAVLSDLMALSAIEDKQAAPPFLTMPVGQKPLKRRACGCDGYWMRVVSNGHRDAMADVVRILATSGIPIEKITEEAWETGGDSEARVIRVHTGQVSEERIAAAIGEMDESAVWRLSETVTLALPRYEPTHAPNWSGETV